MSYPLDKLVHDLGAPDRDRRALEHESAQNEVAARTRSEYQRHQYWGGTMIPGKYLDRDP